MPIEVHLLSLMLNHRSRSMRKLDSGYRTLLTAENADCFSANSQHARAEAADFEVIGVDNCELADWIHKELDWDQLILEFYTPGEPNSGWIHCSYTEGMPRKQFLHAFRQS